MEKNKGKNSENVIPDVEWHTEKRLIKDLIPHPKNPRTLSKISYKDLVRSFKKFNYVELAAINLDNMILAGHQRIYVMQNIGWGDKEIEVRVPSRMLTDAEANEYLIRSNKNTGDWDHEMLANEWEIEDLLLWGWNEKELNIQLDDSTQNQKDLEINQKPLVEIECESDKQQKELYEEFVERGLQCRLLTL